MRKIYILVLALALTLQSCGGNGSKNIEKTTSEDTVSNGIPVLKAERGDIVFVRMDSIVNSFDMYHDLRKIYEEDVTKADTELRTKANVFQKDVNDFREKSEKGLITRSQAEQEQGRLLQRQQRLEEEQNKIRNELAEKEMVLLNQIQNAIMVYVNKYNEEKGYSMIISTSGNSTVLYGNPGLDITSDIIKGINEEYIKSR
ncbi:MAG: OmpH family outer membrane protein [Prevotellaceae bacterium]|jgi:outer membrane protein|nr:OmpH family outer membrane protein [Prevotellaceae bacterium]